MTAFASFALFASLRFTTPGSATRPRFAAGISAPPCRGRQPERRRLAAEAGAALVVLTLTVLLFAACRDERSGQAPAAVTPTVVAVRETARVVRVIDGDTIVVSIGGRDERVRYIGVDTPEMVAPDRPVDCFGPQASARNRALVEGKTVRLERDVSDRDRFGRLLRYVYVDGVFVNAELLREGYATAVTFPPDVRESERFRALEREAQEAGRGLWSACR